MRERRQTLRQTCRTLDPPAEKDFEAPNFIPIDALDSLFLPVPKVGCTNWKKLIMMIEGKNLFSRKSWAIIVPLKKETPRKM